MDRFQLDASAPGLVLAPHLQYPTRDGADICADRVARHLSRHLPYVDLVACDVVMRFEKGDVASRTSFENAMRGRSMAAIRTLVRDSQYLLERFVTPAFSKMALEYLASTRYGFVLFSYICTASLLDRLPRQTGERLHVVWTHNDQIKWFRNLEKTFGNPALKLVARISERWYRHFFARRRGDLLFTYVTEEDLNGHLRHLGPHTGIVVPIGADLVPTLSTHSDAAADPNEIRLLFVGSLSARMNLDALLHFASTYLPALKARFADQLFVTVAGSKPTAEVVALSENHGWTLRPNVSDDELAEIYASSSYALLPFPYSTGAKLKLLGALSHGVPFLASSHVDAQLSSIPSHCVVSDDPNDWITQISAAPRPSESVRSSLHALASSYGWEGVVAEMVERMQSGIPATSLAEQ